MFRSGSTAGFQECAVLNTCRIVELGLIGYSEAWALQKRLVVARKADVIEDVLLLCEHPHVITLGRNAKREHLLASEHVLKQKGVELHATDRGGDITYHGPGQIVGYPILNLGAIRRDVVWYVRMLEEAMIRVTREFGVDAVRESGKTGIWVRAANSAEKLAAIGVRISRWVTSHGFAYNVSTDFVFRSDRSLRDCGSQAHFAGKDSSARHPAQRCYLAPGETFRGCVWFGDEARVAGRVAGETGTRRAAGGPLSIGIGSNG